MHNMRVDKKFGFLVASFFLVCMARGESVAQTACPGGVAAGSAQCGPSPASHSPPANEQPRVRYIHVGTWKDSWGAIAVDSPAGAGGSAKDMRSESDARTHALMECAKEGAKDCEVLIVFKNQCAALAWPSGLRAKVAAARGPTVSEASRLATSSCTNSSGGICEVVYSTCTQPILYEN